MIRLRPAGERGHTRLDWLESDHSFSFDRYYDPDWMSFRSLRVVNEDRVQPGRGFPTHPHRDMEILTYVLEGALEHKDSLGNGSLIRPGELQRMSAGTGIAHSEFNPSDSEPVHLLQIWILPERKGLVPSYEQRVFERDEWHGRWHLLAAPDGRKGALTVHQDVELYAAQLEGGQLLTHAFRPARHAWLQVARGRVSLGELSLAAGDGAAISDLSELEVVATHPAELLLFDLG